MRKFFIAISILVFVASGYSQKLSQVSFLNGANVSYFSILTDQGVLIRLSEDGKLLEYGKEVLSDRGNYYAPKLQPFMARVDYYDAQSDSVFRGKVKSIGSSFITYFNAYDETVKRGKLKSLGSLQFDYYSAYDEKSLQGKLKLIGNLLLEYYKPYENEVFRGKLKAIGSAPITYYSVFDNKFNAGKLKSIGSVHYLWYSDYDGFYSRGSLKSNNYRQVEGGITYILR